MFSSECILKFWKYALDDFMRIFFPEQEDFKWCYILQNIKVFLGQSCKSSSYFILFIYLDIQIILD